MSTDLLRAILSLDAYNRGYNTRVKGLDIEFGETKLGDATIIAQSDVTDNTPGVLASYYAIAYQLGDEKIISYRGTDQLGTDFYSFELGAGSPQSTPSYFASAIG